MSVHNSLNGFAPVSKKTLGDSRSNVNSVMMQPIQFNLSRFVDTVCFQPSAVHIVHCGHLSFSDSFLPWDDLHVQPKPVQLQVSHRHQQFPHFPSLVDRCPRWLCLRCSAPGFNLCGPITHFCRWHDCFGYCYRREVVSEGAPRIHPRFSYQLAAVQQPAPLAVAISSSRVSHDPRRPFQTILAFVAYTLPSE